MALRRAEVLENAAVEIFEHDRLASNRIPVGLSKTGSKFTARSIPFDLQVKDNQLTCKLTFH